MPSQYFLKGKHVLGLALSLSLYANAHGQATRMAEAPTGGKWLSGKEIIDEYTDSTQTGMYSWMKNNAPVSFSETHYDNAITTYNEFGKEDFTIKGVWIVKKDIICYYYRDTRMNAENCFYVLKTGNCYYHFSDSLPKSFDILEQWNSVGYDEDVVPTCVPPIS